MLSKSGSQCRFSLQASQETMPSTSHSEKKIRNRISKLSRAFKSYPISMHFFKLKFIQFQKNYKSRFFIYLIDFFQNGELRKRLKYRNHLQF